MVQNFLHKLRLAAYPIIYGPGLINLQSNWSNYSNLYSDLGPPNGGLIREMGPPAISGKSTPFRLLKPMVNSPLKRPAISY